jgi:ubiquinone/menaquinone biosynthesis C-methylase UbiE
MGLRPLKGRTPELHEAIQGAKSVEAFDRLQRRFRKHNLLQHRAIISLGIRTGHALEIGPGPGYLGLEWLLATDGTRLTGIELSADMIKRAEENAERYGLADRVQYRQGTVARLPFEARTFDAAFSSNSLHHWQDPLVCLEEVHRVLKPGGALFISDLRRDMPLLPWLFIQLVQPTGIVRRGFRASVAAAYLQEEARAMLAQTRFVRPQVTTKPKGLILTAERAPE